MPKPDFRFTVATLTEEPENIITTAKIHSAVLGVRYNSGYVIW